MEGFRNTRKIRGGCLKAKSSADPAGAANPSRSWCKVQRGAPLCMKVAQGGNRWAAAREVASQMRDPKIRPDAWSIQSHPTPVRIWRFRADVSIKLRQITYCPNVCVARVENEGGPTRDRIVTMSNSFVSAGWSRSLRLQRWWTEASPTAAQRGTSQAPGYCSFNILEALHANVHDGREVIIVGLKISLAPLTKQIAAKRLSLSKPR